MLGRLVSRDLATRLDAEREVKRMDAEQIKALLTELQASERRRSLTIYTVLATGYTALFTALYIASTRYPESMKVWGPYSLPLIFLWPYGIALVPARKRRAVLRALEGVDRVEALPGLLNLLANRDLSDRIAFVQPLFGVVERLLPQVSSADLASWPAKSRTELRYMLRTGASRKMASLQLAILKLLERAGDETDVADVTTLIRLARDKTTESRAVIEAANICLEYLAIRSHEKEQSRTLLRGSQRETASPAELLRAAHGESSAAPESLLRAADSGVGQ